MNCEHQQGNADDTLLETNPYLAGYLAGIADVYADKNAPVFDSSVPHSSTRTNESWIPSSLALSTCEPASSSRDWHHNGHATSWQTQELALDKPPEHLDKQRGTELASQADIEGYVNYGHYTQADASIFARHISSQNKRGIQDCVNPQIIYEVNPFSVGLGLSTTCEAEPSNLRPDLGFGVLPRSTFQRANSWDGESLKSPPFPDATHGVRRHVPESQAPSDFPGLTSAVISTATSTRQIIGGLREVSVPSPSEPGYSKVQIAKSNSSKVSKEKNLKDTVQSVFRAYGTKRSRFNEAARKSTALTRRLGACTACQKKRLRCERFSREKFVPCGRCAKLSPHLLAAPCCRVELIELKLFRLGAAATPDILAQWTSTKEFMKGLVILDDGSVMLEPPRRIHITHDFNRGNFVVTVSRFQPGPDDATAYVWSDVSGTEHTFRLPPYYITDMEEAGRNMYKYIWDACGKFPRILLVNSNPIIKRTFIEAERYCKASKSALVATALMLWSATRMIERFWLICGEDKLGIPPLQFDIGPCRRNPHVEAAPVTPLMDTQLDELAVTKVLIPLRAKFLRLLKEKTLAKKKEHWYEIYLASFIILHNFERILQHFIDYGRRFGMNPEPKSNTETSLSHAYYHACKTILVYFHFASGGSAPLSLDWEKEQLDMTTEQVTYLRAMQAELARQKPHLQALKDVSMYENEMYWCQQILFTDWKADMPHQGNLLEFTENDFLCT